MAVDPLVKVLSPRGTVRRYLSRLHDLDQETELPQSDASRNKARFRHGGTPSRATVPHMRLGEGSLA